MKAFGTLFLKMRLKESKPTDNQKNYRFFLKSKEKFNLLFESYTQSESDFNALKRFESLYNKDDKSINQLFYLWGKKLNSLSGRKRLTVYDYKAMLAWLENWELKHEKFILSLNKLKSSYRIFDEYFINYKNFLIKFKKFLRDQIQIKINSSIDIEYWKKISQCILIGDEHSINFLESEWAKMDDNKIKDIQGIKNYLDYFWVYPQQFRFIKEMTMVNSVISNKSDRNVNEYKHIADINLKNVITIANAVLIMSQAYQIIFDKLVGVQLDRLRQYIMIQIDINIKNLEKQSETLDSLQIGVNALKCQTWELIKKELSKLKSEKWQYFFVNDNNNNATANENVKTFYEESISKNQIERVPAIDLFLSAPQRSSDNRNNFISDIDQFLTQSHTEEEKVGGEKKEKEAEDKLEEELKQEEILKFQGLIDVNVNITKKISKIHLYKHPRPHVIPLAKSLDIDTKSINSEKERDLTTSTSPNIDITTTFSKSPSTSSSSTSLTSPLSTEPPITLLSVNSPTYTSITSQSIFTPNNSPTPTHRFSSSSSKKEKSNSSDSIETNSGDLSRGKKNKTWPAGTKPF